jgi:hypothetical protein
MPVWKLALYTDKSLFLIENHVIACIFAVDPREPAAETMTSESTMVDGMNHPFVDGNKRVALFATDVFLRLHGWGMVVDADEAHAFLIGLLERGECRFENLIEWVRRSVERMPSENG